MQTRKMRIICAVALLAQIIFSFFQLPYSRQIQAQTSSTQSPDGEDTNPPVVHWVFPVVPYDTVIPLEASAEDDVAVDRVHFFLWDSIAQQRVTIGVDYAAPYTGELNLSSLRHGWHQVCVEAYDTSNNRSNIPYFWIYRPSAPVYIPDVYNGFIPSP